MMIRIKPFILSLVAAGALVLAVMGTSHAQGDQGGWGYGSQGNNSVPTSAFCSCTGSPAPACSGALITPAKNQVFALTELVVGSSPINTLTLDDDSSTKVGYEAPGGNTTTTQTFKPPIIFKTNVTVACSSSSATFITVDGVLITQP